MATHRRRRRYGSMVRIPGLGQMPRLLGRSVNTTDVLMGAALGFGGTLLMKGAGNRMLAGKVPDFVLKGSPLIGGLVTGAALYAFGKNKQRGASHLFGALMAGASVQAWDTLKTQFPAGLGDVVSLKFSQYGQYGNILIDEATPAVGPGGAAYGGLIVDEPGRALSDANLGQLAAMHDYEESGIEELMY